MFNIEAPLIPPNLDKNPEDLVFVQFQLSKTANNVYKLLGDDGTKDGVKRLMATVLEAWVKSEDCKVRLQEKLGRDM